MLKLVYLADLEARKLLGHPVSDFEYIWYNHGPFDSAIYDAIEELVGLGMAETQEIGPDPQYVEKRLVDLGDPADFDFSPGELHILRYVAEEYMHTRLKDLLYEIVYQTPPMKAVEKKGERLPMEMVDNIDLRRVGFDLEEVLASEAAADAGDAIILAEFLDELRSDFGASLS